ncbi:MAG: tail fiber protein, partial [Bdellovibrio sp.]|nr:tail fiber protein [Bdellovibrio sp.]
GSVVLALGDPVKALRTYPTSGSMKWYDAFNNTTPTYTCQTTGTFSPTLLDNRRLVMQFNDGGGSGWQTLPPMDINSVPFAMFAETSEKLGINTAADFILGTAIPSCSGSDVLTRIAGTFSCITAAAATSMNPSGLLAGGASTGQVLKFNGTNWVPSSDDTGAAGTLSGDITGTLSSATIAAGAVTNSKITSMAFSKLTGIPTTLSGHSITMTSADVTTALGYTPGTGSGSINSSDVTTALGYTPANGIAWSDAGAGKINYSGGNVGIGATAPALKLDVEQLPSQGSVTKFGKNMPLYIMNMDSYTEIGFNEYTDSSGGYQYRYGKNSSSHFAGSLQFDNLGGDLAYWNSGSGNQDDPVNGRNLRFIIRNNGNFGIGGNPATSALLEVKSVTKGFLLPRMTSAQRDAIASPATGLQIYNTTGNTIDFYNGTTWTTSSSFSGGGDINGSNGAVNITAGGTNQSITLAGSGTGVITTPSVTTITNNTASLSAASGALVVTGGVGVGGAVNVTGNINSGANIQAATSVISPTVSGGSGVGGNLTLQSTSDATKGTVIIDGTIRITGGTPGVGKILTASDASGNATWVASAGLPANSILTYQVRATTTANITLSGSRTVDGILVVAGDRVLVKNQSTTSQNGIYVVAAGAWVRASDLDTWNKSIGYLARVTEGNVYRGAIFTSTATSGGVIDTTSMSWIMSAPSSSTVAFGDQAAPNSAAQVVAIGSYALWQNTSGTDNTGIGNAALWLNTSGTGNTAVGSSVGTGIQTSSNSTALGYSTLSLAGGNNTAIGAFTLLGSGLGAGAQNTALGAFAGRNTAAGNNNVALGYSALTENQAKSESTAVGYSSMYYADSTTTPAATYNTAIGAFSLQGSNPASANTGIKNTALGHSALAGMTSGSNNIGVGWSSGSAITTGSNNVVIGSNTGSSFATGSNNISINDGAGNERIRVLSTGNVGIGTTTPQTTLDVAGGIRAGSSGITTGAACSPEGTMAYDVVAHAPVFCNQSLVWATQGAGSGNPAGTIIDFAGTACPSTYLILPLVATNVSRTTYSTLFAAIGTTWGVGDGSTTFGLPFFAADYAAVRANGNVGTTTVGQVIAHTHDLPGTIQLYGTSVGDSGVLTQISSQATTSTGGSANLAAGSRVLKCIKL